MARARVRIRPEIRHPPPPDRTPPTPDDDIAKPFKSPKNREQFQFRMDQAKHCFGLGLDASCTARIIGVAPSTLLRWLHEDPEMQKTLLEPAGLLGLAARTKIHDRLHLNDDGGYKISEKSLRDTEKDAKHLCDLGDAGITDGMSNDDARDAVNPVGE